MEDVISGYSKMTLEGFHGTDMEGAIGIERNGFDDSPSDAWLGPGVYFFEDLQPAYNGEKEALWWVKQYKKYPHWVIYHSRIVVDTTNVFDMLCNDEHIATFGRLRDLAIKHFQDAGNNISDFKIASVFLRIGRVYEVIRCPVNGAKEKTDYKDYIIYRPQLQLCVRKTLCIDKPIRVNEE